MMIFSLVAMTGLEKCCITSAYLQWLCHSGERPVARGPLVYLLRFIGFSVRLHFSLGRPVNSGCVRMLHAQMRLHFHGLTYCKSTGNHDFPYDIFLSFADVKIGVCKNTGTPVY